EAARGEHVVADELDAILVVARDPIVSDDDRDRGSGVGPEPDLDSVVAVVPDHIALDVHADRAVDIDAIVAVPLEDAAMDEAAPTGFVVEPVARLRHPGIQEID